MKLPPKRHVLLIMNPASGQHDFTQIKERLEAKPRQAKVGLYPEKPGENHGGLRSERG